jgi:hypothetical protein
MRTAMSDDLCGAPPYALAPPAAAVGRSVSASPARLFEAAPSHFLKPSLTRAHDQAHELAASCGADRLGVRTIAIVATPANSPAETMRRRASQAGQPTAHPEVTPGLRMC